MYNLFLVLRFIDIAIFLVGIFMFIRSLIKKNDKYIFWCLIVNIGNIICQILWIILKRL